MAFSYTPNQQRVIDTRNSNILVSAAAGSGKTAVLVERIVRMVCEEKNPVDIDRLLIVTFTGAAASEMRERIAEGIQKKLLENPLSAHIQKQATLLHNAQITTIDSFCLFLLRNHFNEIGLDPAFRIADEGEIKLLQQDVLAQLFEDAYASGEEAFQEMVEVFCPEGRESRLEQYVLNLSRYASSFPWPEEWLLERKKDYLTESVEEICQSDYGRYLTEDIRRMITGCREKLEQAERICEEPDGPYMYGELLEKEIGQLERLEGMDSLEKWEGAITAVSFDRLPSKKDESVSPVKRELAKNIRNQVKSCIQEIGEKFFATPLVLAAEQGRACEKPVAVLIDFVLEFNRRMQEKKREKKIVDFSDMEHFALDILIKRKNGKMEASDVAREYRQHFAEVLIDEYQDSNLVQEYLLSAVSGEEEGHFNRFMVGDVKQSIYRFRLARPELFLEKYESYGEEGDYIRIDLAKNFRSRSEVVEGVNAVFSRIMSRENGGLAYDDKAALYAGAAFPENPLPYANDSELILVNKPGSEEALDAKEAEAKAIAGKIKELQGSLQVTDKASGELRPLKYSDIVILLRSNSGWDEPFKKTLEAEGIPVYITSKTGYFAASEVQELLQFLRVLDNPRQDIPLFGAMKSLFGGFTEEEIALIRSGQKRGTLYDALKNCSQEEAKGTEEGTKKGTDAGTEEGTKEGTDARIEEGTKKGTEEGAERRTEEGTKKGTDAGIEEGAEKRTGQETEEERLDEGIEEAREKLGKKAARFLERITSYRQMAVYLPVRELLTRIATDFHYLDYVTALPAGSKRRANVEMLFTKASDFEKTSYFGLFHFIRYMEQLEKYDMDYGEADSLDENADVVRIMSIHKSKGLEFPVCFVGGLSKRFNMQDVNQSLIVDMDLGLATDYVDTKRRVRNKTLRRLALARKLREDSLSEELRVLYVALTRAREKLIMTAVLDKAQEKWEMYQSMAQEQLSFPDFIEAGSYLDFLLPVLGKTGITVTVMDSSDLEKEAETEQLLMGGRRFLLEEAKNRTDLEALEGLKKRLSAKYAYENLAGLYTKTTVSELKIAAMAGKDEEAYHAFEEKELVPYIPAFRGEEEKVTGTVRGNAYHRAMELLDFPLLLQEKDRTKREKCLEEFLREKVEKGRLTKEYFEALSMKKLMAFLDTPLAERMCLAQKEGRLYREQPFVLGISANRLKADFPEEETVLIQGIMDVFFVEEDGIVLLDYKTDAVNSMEELWNRYETQLTYYSEALQKLLQKPVKERLLYSFRLNTYDARIVGVRSTEQSVGIKVGGF